MPPLGTPAARVAAVRRAAGRGHGTWFFFRAVLGSGVSDEVFVGFRVLYLGLTHGIVFLQKRQAGFSAGRFWRLYHSYTSI